MGKGSRYRLVNQKKYGENFDKIFGKSRKDKSKLKTKKKGEEK